ncbi:hypothetical protein EDD21DRAFT_38556 [Dissophora ornata]|nr:hypothetical protein EDD21DRAFT_38556 [Dissophora ornata]
MDDNTILSLCFPSVQAGGPADEATTRIFQQLCDEQSRLNHCQASLHVTVSSCGSNSSVASSINSSTTTLALNSRTGASLDTHHPSVVYNVTLSGPYQEVMLARGAFLRNNPLKQRQQQSHHGFALVENKQIVMLRLSCTSSCQDSCLLLFTQPVAQHSAICLFVDSHSPPLPLPPQWIMGLCTFRPCATTVDSREQVADHIEHTGRGRLARYGVEAGTW